MTLFAVIENGVVSNCIVAENLESAQAITEKTCVEYEPTNPHVKIGSTYSNGVFNDPNYVEPAVFEPVFESE